ncbi:hypothetical protein CR513_57144, partial [Mucuna pruriens]
MGEIKTWAEKHIEAKEDLANRLQVKREAPSFLNKGRQGHPEKANPQQGGNHKIEANITYGKVLDPEGGVPHTLAGYSPFDETLVGVVLGLVLRIHYTYEHTTENCKTLKTISCKHKVTQKGEGVTTRGLVRSKPQMTKGRGTRVETRVNKEPSQPHLIRAL